MEIKSQKTHESPMNLEVAESMWVLGLLDSDLIPGIATEALMAGIDSPLLRQLAGLEQNELQDSDQLFRKTLLELGKGHLTKNQAVMNYAIFISEQIVAARENPYEGARKIWKATLKLDDRNFHDLDAFLYAASEFPSRPEDQGFFSAEIIKEAKRLLEEKSHGI